MDRNICMVLKEIIFVQIIDRYIFAEFLMKSQIRWYIFVVK